TNDDQPAHITVIKHVNNDNAGTKQAGDFTLGVLSIFTGVSPTSFAGSESGTDVTLNATQAYRVDEDPVTGYSMTLGPGCVGSIDVGERKTCTVTNDDVAPAPALTVIKRVVNDSGGNAGAGDWTMTVNNNGTSLPSFTGSAAGVTVTLAPGAYSVAESGGPAGYTPTVSAGCGGTIASGEHKTCTITNDDQ